MDVESHDGPRSALALLKIIAQGEADVAAGHLVSQEEAFAEASRAFGRAMPPRESKRGAKL